MSYHLPPIFIFGLFATELTYFGFYSLIPKNKYPNNPPNNPTQPKNHKGLIPYLSLIYYGLF